MALDKWLDSSDGDEIPDKLDNSFLEKGIMKLFLIDIIRLIRIKATLSKQFHIQPSEIDKFTYWEYELWIKCLNELVEEENKSQKDEMDKYKVQDTMRSVNSGQFAKNMTPQMPKLSMPNFGSMKMPM